MILLAASAVSSRFSKEFQNSRVIRLVSVDKSKTRRKILKPKLEILSKIENFDEKFFPQMHVQITKMCGTLWPQSVWRHFKSVYMRHSKDMNNIRRPFWLKKILTTLTPWLGPNFSATSTAKNGEKFFAKKVFKCT